jgi:prepilin-type N-terminal cleavage/methylation domain-containing protein
MKQKENGFTLIELLVVIAIIALLLSIIAPSLNKAKEAAKLMLCANNQHQAVLGLQTYTIDNDGKFPPHPADRNGKGNSFSVINYFSYTAALDNRGLYHYVGGYLPLVDVFRCPLGRSKDTELLQWQYEDYLDFYASQSTGSNFGAHSSYNYYFGYKMTMSDDTKFVGPTGKGARGESNLLLSDTIYDWGGDPKQWWLAHKPRKGSGIFRDDTHDSAGRGNYVKLYWIYEPSFVPSDGTLPVELRELKYNASYTDGSVRKYSGSEVKQSNRKFFYIPGSQR